MTDTPMHRVFVYGTLKAGKRNHGVNTGRRLGGAWRTLRPHPLYLVGPTPLPWLVDRPGEGHPVQGEVYEVDDAGLARMDALERIHDAGWYRRAPLQVLPLDDAGAPADEPVTVWVYFGDAARWSPDEVHAGPLAAYDGS